MFECLRYLRNVEEREAPSLPSSPPAISRGARPQLPPTLLRFPMPDHPPSGSQHQSTPPPLPDARRHLLRFPCLHTTLLPSSHHQTTAPPFPNAGRSLLLFPMPDHPSPVLPSPDHRSSGFPVTGSPASSSHCRISLLWSAVMPASPPNHLPPPQRSLARTRHASPILELTASLLDVPELPAPPGCLLGGSPTDARLPVEGRSQSSLGAQTDASFFSGPPPTGLLPGSGSSPPSSRALGRIGACCCSSIEAQLSINDRSSLSPLRLP